jgi:DNA uptake protein ComE-like DNA-binding protein
MPNPFKEFFTFTKGERQGIMVLLIIIALLLLGNMFMPFFLSQKPTDFSEFVKEIEAFEKQFQKDSSAKNHAKKSFTQDEPYLRFEEKEEEEKPKANKPGFDKKIYDYPKKEYAYRKLHIDLNTADTTELMQLRGIGPTFAKRIVKYRDMLGGYFSKEQLLEVYGFDSLKYEMVKDEVYANDSAIVKINLNKAALKDMTKHVYIDWKLANAIIKHRFRKPFENVDELREVYLVNDSLFRKLAPYFTVEK